MSSIKKVLLESKIMGLVYYVPFLVSLVLIIYSFTIKDMEEPIRKLILSYKSLVPVFAIWWPIYMLYDLLEEEGGEVLFTYRVSKFLYGVVTNIKYLALYSVLMVITFCISTFICNGIYDIKFILLIVFQCIFYASFSFAIMSVLKNSGWTTFIIVIFFCFMTSTGESFGFINLHTTRALSYPTLEDVQSVIMKSIIWSIVFYTFGQISLNKAVHSTKNFGKGGR